MIKGMEEKLVLFIEKLACIQRSNRGVRHVASISGCDAMVHYIRVLYFFGVELYCERIREEEERGEISRLGTQGMGSMER